MLSLKVTSDGSVGPESKMIEKEEEKNHIVKWGCISEVRA